MTQARARKFSEQQRRDLIAAIVTDTTLRPLGMRAGVLLATRFLNVEQGEAWPSMPHLQDELGCDRSALQRAMRGLEGRYFHTVKATGRGRGNVTRYRPIWPKKAAVSPPFVDEKPAEKADSRHDKRRTPGNIKGGLESALNLVKESSEGNPGKNPPPEFQKFEEIYAKPAGDNFGSREKAIQAFREICESGVSPIRIIEGTRGWTTARAKQGDKAAFAFAAARFLREGMWKTLEPRWARYWAHIVEADPGDEARADWETIWRKTFGGPLPGEPDSVFPPELIPAPERDAA
jgi:hypothetical protein